MGYLSNLNTFLLPYQNGLNNKTLNIEKANKYLIQTVRAVFQAYDQNKGVYSIQIKEDLPNYSMKVVLIFVNTDFYFVYQVKYLDDDYYLSPKFYTGYSILPINPDLIEVTESSALNGNDRLTEDGLGQDILDYLTLYIANSGVSLASDQALVIRTQLDVYSKSEVYNKTETYNKSEVYNKIELNAFGLGSNAYINNLTGDTLVLRKYVYPAGMNIVLFSNLPNYFCAIYGVVVGVGVIGGGVGGVVVGGVGGVVVGVGGGGVGGVGIQLYDFINATPYTSTGVEYIYYWATA